MKIIFTHHAEERISRKQIAREEAIDAIKHPDAIIKKYANPSKESKLLLNISKHFLYSLLSTHPYQDSFLLIIIQ